MLDLGVNIYGGEVLSSIFFNSRFFTDLQASLLQHYVLDNTVTLSGDFEIEITTTISLDTFILGGETTSDWLTMTAGGELYWKINNQNLVSTGLGLVADKSTLHISRLRRVAGVATLYFDGNIVDTDTGITGDFTVSQIGAITNLQHFDGIIANLKITDQGVLTHDLPIDEDRTNDVVVNHVSGSLGGELLSGPPSLMQDNWTSPSDGVYVSDGVSTVERDLGWLGMLVSGNSYLITLDLDWTSGTLLTWTGSINIPWPQSSGRHTLLINQDGTTTFNVNSGASVGNEFVGTVSNISVKQATGYATAAAITSDSAELFTQVGDDWLGVKLANSSTFNFTTTSNFEQVPQVGSGDLVVGNTYKATAINATANTFRFRPFAGSYVSSLDLTADAQTSELTWQGNQIGDYELSNISVKRLLEVAP